MWRQQYTGGMSLMAEAETKVVELQAKERQ